MVENVQNLHGEYQNVLLPTGQKSLLDLADFRSCRHSSTSFDLFAAYDLKYPMSKRLWASSKDLDHDENRRNMQFRDRSLPPENTFNVLSFGDLSQENRSWQATPLITPSVPSNALSFCAMRNDLRPERL